MTIENLRSLKEKKDTLILGYVSFADMIFSEYKNILGIEPSKKNFIEYMENSYPIVLGELNTEIMRTEVEIIDTRNFLQVEYGYKVDKFPQCGNCEKCGKDGVNCEYGISDDYNGWCRLHERTESEY